MTTKTTKRKPFPSKPLKGEVRPLGTAKKGHSKKSGTPDKTLASDPSDAVVSGSEQPEAMTVPDTNTKEREQSIMAETRTVTFKNLSKSGQIAIYSGLPVNIRIPITAFPDKTPIASFEATGDWAAPKAKMTAKERKAARLAAPKPTAAERVAALEAKLERMRVKAAKEAEAAPVA